MRQEGRGEDYFGVFAAFREIRFFGDLSACFLLFYLERGVHKRAQNFGVSCVKQKRSSFVDVSYRSIYILEAFSWCGPIWYWGAACYVLCFLSSIPCLFISYLRSFFWQQSGRMRIYVLLTFELTWVN